MTTGNFDKVAPASLHTRGIFRAALASICIAAVLGIAMLVGATSGGAFDAHCNTTESSGILFEMQPELPSRYDDWKAKRGQDRSFPPGTQCLLYGRVNDHNSSKDFKARYQLAADRYYPSSASYLWLVALVISPFIFLIALRLYRLTLKKMRALRT